MTIIDNEQAFMEWMQKFIHNHLNFCDEKPAYKIYRDDIYPHQEDIMYNIKERDFFNTTLENIGLINGKKEAEYFYAEKMLKVLENIEATVQKEEE